MMHTPHRVRRSAAVLAAILTTVLAPAAASAQDFQERFVADFERMRENVPAMVDSMPDGGLRFAPTE